MPDATNARRRGPLDLIEWVGNKLPDPAFIFVFGAVLVMVLSAVGHYAGWSVQPKMLRPVVEVVLDPEGQPVIDPETGEAVTRPVLDERSRPVLELVEDLSRNEGLPYTTRSLFSADGLYYAISSMVDNFVKFPPLGVVLVGMLGIGLAERSGFIGAALKAMMLAVPRRLLTPTMLFLGIMSSLGTDAGYVVLPPVAAALYVSVGRSPLAGIAAVFAGVSAGFNANLLVTSLDPLLAGFTTTGAQVIDTEYHVAPTCNWWFMIASTVVITAIGWITSDYLVEPRYAGKSAAEGGPSPVRAEDAEARRLRPEEIRGLFAAFAVLIVATLLFVSFKLVPGWPFDDGRGRIGPMEELARAGDKFDRWVEAIVPLLFILFLLPGVVYGVVVKTIRNSNDAARLMVESMAAMAPIIVLAFFAAQFIEYFKYSNLDKMLAYTGGEFLAGANLSPFVLMVAFVLLTAVFNLFVGSMSAKYAMFAPIFVPMFMIIGISPELTQAAYRIGDSTTNIITPLNAYLVIILVVMQKYAPKAGMGSLISMMLPYTITFTITWLVMLMLWMWVGADLGPGGPLTYEAGL